MYNFVAAFVGVFVVFILICVAIDGSVQRERSVQCGKNVWREEASKECD